MAFTPLLGLSLPVTGSLSGTWGDEINNSITSLVDSAVAGTTTLSTDADVTLTTTSGVANTAREAILLCSGARTAVRYITAPATSKTYTVINATTGGYNVYIRGAGPTAGIAVPMGYSVKVAWNGSDFVQMSVPVSNVSGLGTGVATALAISVGTAGSPVVNGGALGTPSSGTLTSATGLPISTGVSGLGTGVATALAVNVGTAGSPVVNGGALGTPSSGTVTNLTGSGNFTATGGASGAIAATTLSASSTVSGTGFSTYLASPPAIGGTAAAAVSATALSYSTTLTGGTGIVNLGSGQFYKDASGNVGIGTSSPGTKLQALGIIKSGGTGTNGEFNLARTSDGLSVGKITLTESTQILDYNNLLGSGAHTFTINAVERMRIDASGNVGIGTASPSTKLSVVSATNAGISVSDGTVNTIIYNSTGGIASIGTTTNHPIAFYQNNTERMRLDLGANLLVGISTTPTVGTNLTGNLVVANDIASGSLLLGTNGSFLGRQASDGSTVLNTGQASIIFSRGVYGSAPTTLITLANDGRLYGTALHNNAGSVTGTTTQYIASGTYTPTLTNVATISSSTAFLCQWIRVGNVVTVSGRVDITASVAGFIFNLGVSFPIASTITATTNCAGTFGAGSAATTGSPCILGDTTNVRATFSAAAALTSSTSYYFTFTYLVL